MAGTRRFRAAFSPTVDCAILVAAFEKGFAADEGVALELIRMNGPRDILDAWSSAELDGAHLSVSLPVALALPSADVEADLIVPFILATGGSTLVVSPLLYDDLVEQGMKIPDPGSVARALSRVAMARQKAELPPLIFATEHSSSTSTYELLYLIASTRLIGKDDVTIMEAAPANMPSLLRHGSIDGFYVGEPYGSAVTMEGEGRIVTTKSHIWQNGPEKGLAVSRQWAETNEQTLHAIIRAFYRAGEWCASAANREELADLLASPTYLACEIEHVLASLSGFIPHSPARLLECHDFLCVSGNAANFPWQSQALWFFNQMIRWNECPPQVAAAESVRDAAAEVFRPDIFRRAVRPLFAPVPAANMKLEGTLNTRVYVGADRAPLLLGPDTFFDGEIFDPESFATHHES